MSLICIELLGATLRRYFLLPPSGYLALVPTL